MRFVLILSSVFCVLCLASGGHSIGTSQGEQPEPRIVFEETTYDFLIASPEDRITHTFTFKNTGMAPLRIEKVIASCACTTTVFANQEIFPGQQGMIVARYEPRPYQEMQNEVISVFTNDPVHGQVDLTIKGRVKRGLFLIPQGVNFGVVRKGRAVSRRVKLFQLTPEPVVLKKIVSNAGVVKVSTSRFREEHRRGIYIDITLGAGAPEGSFMESITLFTNNKRYPRIDIPMLATIEAK